MQVTELIERLLFDDVLIVLFNCDGEKVYEGDVNGLGSGLMHCEVEHINPTSYTDEENPVFEIYVKEQVR